MKIPFVIKRKKSKIVSRSPRPNNKSRSVYSYSSARKEANRRYNRGDEPKQFTVFKLASKFTRYASVVLILAIASYLLMLSPNAQVKLSGQTVIERPANSYEDVINQKLKGSISNYTKITINNDKLVDQIMSQFPEVSSAKISIPLIGNRPKVTLVFADASLKLQSFDDDTYILDEQGRALARSSEASGGVNQSKLLKVIDTSSQKVELGKTILTQEQIEFIDQIVFQAKEKKLSIASISLTGGTSQLSVQYTDVKYVVKYSFFANPRQSSGAYFALREQLKRDNKTPIQYVDLRIPGRAYVN